MRDHLGSVRTVLDITRDTSEVNGPTLAILEQNDYLPFGTRIDLDSLAYDQSNRYRFNGKEEQVTGGIGLTDYGARYYDNFIPRWTTIDPLAEKYYGISPYAFCNNNPVNFVDLDGRDWVAITETGKVEWRDDITKESKLPDGVLYVGASNDDILRYLNINHSFVTQETTVPYAIGDTGNNGNVQYAIAMNVHIPVTANMTVSADVSLNSENITENNKYGRTFNGVQFTASLTQQSSLKLNPFSHEASATFAINYGGQIYDDIMSTPTEPYVRATRTSVLAGSVKIPADRFAPHRSFSKATITAGVLYGGVYSKPKSINWGITRHPSLRAIR